MTDGTTPDENKQIPPASQPATLPVDTGDKVTLSKEEHTRLVKDAARASEAQSRADRLQAAAGRSRTSSFANPPKPAPQPTAEEREAYAVEEDRKAEQGLTRLALDPKYRDAFDADPTLRDLFTNNPLGILPIFAKDALDAEDAVSLVREKLDTRVAEIAAKKVVTPAEDESKKNDTVPPAGGVNTASSVADPDYEAARKLPNVENAIAGMIKVGLKKIAGK